MELYSAYTTFIPEANSIDPTYELAMLRIFQFPSFI